MARRIIRLPFHFSRMLLRGMSTLIAFVFAMFTYATGQTPRASSAQPNPGKVFAAPGALNGITAPEPDYGIGPLYGVVEYGMPYADFSVKGILRSDKSSQPVAGIQVTLQDTLTKEIIDTLSTSADGAFAFQMTGRLPGLNTWILKAVDVDGAAHGSFADKDTLITIPNDSLKGGTGFYAGSAEAKIEMYLHDKATKALPREGSAGGQLALTGTVSTVDGRMTVEYQLPAAAHVRLGLYDAGGRLVMDLVNTRSESGSFTASLDAASLVPGFYYLKLNTGADVVISKISILR